MRYFHKHQDRLKEYWARLLATLVLLSMGWGALRAWQWLLALLD